MNDTTRLREDVLLALDARFAPIGFRRRKGSFAWKRKAVPGVVHSFHVNFGLYPRAGTLDAHPSVGARHDVIERDLVAAGMVVGKQPDRVTFGKMLSDLAGGALYETDLEAGGEPLAATLWADWCSVGRPYTEQISDLEAVIELLQAHDPAAWCCFGADHRARLLPLALAAVGRRDAALRALDWLGADLGQRDQLLPPFTQFETWFRAQAA